MPNWKKIIVSGSDAALNSLNITTSLTASGNIYPTGLGVDRQILKTDGAGNITFGYPEDIVAIVKNVSGGTLLKGTPVHATASGALGNVVGIIAASASDASTMPATFILNETLIDEAEGEALAVGFIQGVDTSAFEVGQIVYVGPNGGYVGVKPTGSNLIQNLGVVSKVSAINGSGYILGAGRSNDVPNIQPGYTWVGNSNSVATPLATSSIQNVISSSNALTASNITPAITNNTDNYVLTANGNGTINGESLLQFDGQKLSVLYQAGDEGGEILLGKAATNTTLTGSGITVDVWQNRLRFFEQGGTARGYFLDISSGSAGVGTNLASGAPDIVEIMYFNTNATSLSDNTNYTFTTNTTLTTSINATPGIPLPIGTVVGWRLSTYWASSPVGSSETGTLKLYWGSGPSEVTLSTAITWDGNRTAVFSGSLSQAITAVEPSWAFVTTPNFATNPQGVKMVLILQIEI
jgi:hypothetical protein